MKRISRAGLARNIASVASLINILPKRLTRAEYLRVASGRDLKVIRSKGTISRLGGFVKARQLVR